MILLPSFSFSYAMRGRLPFVKPSIAYSLLLMRSLLSLSLSLCVDANISQGNAINNLSVDGGLNFTGIRMWSLPGPNIRPVEIWRTWLLMCIMASETLCHDCHKAFSYGHMIRKFASPVNGQRSSGEGMVSLCQCCLNSHVSHTTCMWLTIQAAKEVLCNILVNTDGSCCAVCDCKETLMYMYVCVFRVSKRFNGSWSRSFFMLIGNMLPRLVQCQAHIERPTSLITIAFSLVFTLLST